MDTYEGFKLSVFRWLVSDSIVDLYKRKIKNVYPLSGQQDRLV